jgi:hypothetical protein
MGLHVKNSILMSHKQYASRVHYLPIDADKKINKEEFKQKVHKVVNENQINPVNLMFIVDEILPGRYWNELLDALDTGDYKNSHVWCADGLLPQRLGAGHDEKFHRVTLRSTCRIPVSVQKVLNHVAWEEVRLDRYLQSQKKEESVEGQAAIAAGPSSEGAEGTALMTRRALRSQAASPSADASARPASKGNYPDPHTSGQSQKLAKDSTTEVKTSVSMPTRGPIPLSIRHESHPQDVAVVDCVQCADELAELLIHRLKLLEEISANSSASGATSAEANILPCSIVVLFSIPEEKYKDAPTTEDEEDIQRVEISKERFEEYAKLVDSSPFVQRLEKRLPSSVKIAKFLKVSDDKEEHDFESKKLWNDILLCWVDKFQGLVRDVVIYLPSERSPITQRAINSVQTHDAPAFNTADKHKRNIPLPGVTAAESAGTPKASATTAAGKRKIPLPGVTVPEKKPKVTFKMKDVGDEDTTAEKAERSDRIPRPASPRSPSPKSPEASSPRRSLRRKSVEEEAEPGSSGKKSSPRDRSPAPSSKRRPLKGRSKSEEEENKGEEEEKEAMQTEPSSDQPATSQASSSSTSRVPSHPDDSKSPPSKADLRKLAHMYWRKADIARYSQWDQTNLMLAASRSTAQLILLVP